MHPSDKRVRDPTSSGKDAAAAFGPPFFFLLHAENLKTALPVVDHEAGDPLAAHALTAGKPQCSAGALSRMMPQASRAPPAQPFLRSLSSSQ